MRIYVNGARITNLAISSYPAQNANLTINSAAAHYIGRRSDGTQSFDGYMTEINFIDGQALTPASFGRNNVETGVWEPLAYTGTYGTNGFYLNFSDNSGTTSTTLGKDSSGNGNNWTPNNFSVTAGAGNDSLVDSPTSYGTDTGVGGEVRGNYATLNPLNWVVTEANGAAGTLSDGNLRITGSTNGSANAVATIMMPSGKWYFEAISYTGATTGNRFRIQNDSGTQTVLRFDSGLTTTSDVLMVAVDADSGKVWFGVNNVWDSSGNPSAGTNPNGTITSYTFLRFMVQSYNSSYSAAVNFGQRAFAYTAPSGFKALCTQNLPTPTIGATSTTQANDYMNVVTYTATENVASSITGVGFQPDFVWVKTRADAASHALTDAVRGVQKALFSNTTGAEITSSTYLTSFNSDGFTQGGAGNFARNSLVAWNWKANGAGSSNTAGTITSTVSANTTSGFSIATLTAQSSGTGTFGHGLGVAPSMVITKLRAAANAWATWHISIPNTQYLELNTTNAAQTAASYWNSTSPTSSVVSLGTAWAGAGTMVAYCFAPVASYSSFGSYVGNGSTDGPFVYTGFRPRFVMIKISSGSTGSWWIWDSARNTYNVATNILAADSSGAEISPYNCDFLSNGFKLRDATGQLNGSGYTIIYASFAENPFKYSLAR
jgi:hypothetical protein